MKSKKFHDIVNSTPESVKLKVAKQMDELDEIAMLLRPRVMVTNEWPGCPYDKGKILPPNCGEFYELPEGAEVLTAAQLCERYPADFREMHWSEERTPEEMPKYLRDTITGTVFIGSETFAFYPNNFANTVFAERTAPATEFEYITYQNSLK